MAGKHQEHRNMRETRPCRFANTSRGCTRRDCPFVHPFSNSQSNLFDGSSISSRSLESSKVLAGDNRKNGPVCRFYKSAAGCKKGDGCNMLHDDQVERSSGLTNGSSVKRGPGKAQTSLVQARFDQWAFLAPEDSMNLMPLGPKLGVFFRTARELIHGGDTQIRLMTITVLAAEGGLRRIKEAVEVLEQYSEKNDCMLHYEDVTLPLFETLSHHEVLASLVLESKVDAIYNFLFGPGGRRSVGLFTFVIKVHRLLLDEPRTPQLSMVADLTVFHKIIELNGTAKLIEAFRPIVELFSDLIPQEGDRESGRARELLRRICQLLDLGASIPDCGEPRTGVAGISQPTFEVGRDQPGELSPHGVRHDNDFENISRIQIMPTPDEIQSQRMEYLPIIDPSKLHLKGAAGLLDRHFRLLREDTIGQLRDAVRHQLNRLANQNSFDGRVPKQGATVRVYEKVKLESIGINHRRGLRLLISFEQPMKMLQGDQLRDQWEASKNLLSDALVCLIDSTGLATFMSVCDERTDHSGVGRPDGLYKNPSRVELHLRLIEPFENNLDRALQCFPKDKNTVTALVEFPGIILPSFKPTLEALQRMSGQIDIPFSDWIAPVTASKKLADMPPPLYSRPRGFFFDLSCLTKGEPLFLSPNEPFNQDVFAEYSTLDRAQQRAVVEALRRELALIQGPPGTGKSYTGVAIIKVLLANARSADLGPIICVCYTNHALDQLLEHLVKAGIEQIIRIGSRSKSDLLEPANLQKVVATMADTNYERHEKRLLRVKRDKLGEEIEDDLHNLYNKPSLQLIKDYLMDNHYRHYVELFQSKVDHEGFIEVNHDRRDPITRWLAPSRPFKPGHPFLWPRSIRELLTEPTSGMTLMERQILFGHWEKDIQSILKLKLVRQLQEFEKVRTHLTVYNQELQLRCLSQAKIIGVTTSGLAKELNVLRRLPAKVLVCEEAGEVLEAHLLTALLPSIEHAILIGDHEQLRPQIHNYDLQHDNPRGQQYSLDMSLFERLIHPSLGAACLPFNTLETQRRMYPTIARLVRDTLYPKLQDHISVSEYPEVMGMAKRLFWLDHREKESESEMSTSHSNLYEIEMTAALVSHLVRQGMYQSEDIVIITPYLGQLVKLRRRLASSFELVVGDLDAADLEKQGLVDDLQNSVGTGPFRKGTLLKALRIATVDNFQGEEAKVVVVSLVRSNIQNKCGFLRTSNRINVLLSRAKHGMYIIGNSETYLGVPMWEAVIRIFQENGDFGSKLALCCPRHPGKLIEVSTPDDFVQYAPEGGCSERCQNRLNCGHKCPQKCHSEPLHSAVFCVEDCPRAKSGCDHSCPLRCGAKCHDKCLVIVHGVQLECGHIQDVKCYEAQNKSLARCKTIVSKTVPGCKHVVQVTCSTDVMGEGFDCLHSCDTILVCGHACTKKCKGCNDRENGKIKHTDHGQCQVKCAHPFNTCNHTCPELCHDGRDCSKCMQRCEVRCDHSTCARKCSEPCQPCAERCNIGCPHQGICELPCSVPCDLFPCSLRCEKLLSCGHRCPSLCSETCPPVRSCQICCDEDVKNQQVDFILGETYQDINLDSDPCMFLPCEHIITMSNMDGHMSMSKHYEIAGDGSIVGLKGPSLPFSSDDLKACPTCRFPLQNINRYSRIVRRAQIDQATKKFIAWSNEMFVPLTQRLQVEEKQLEDANYGLEPQHDCFKDDVATESGKTPPLRLQGGRHEIIKAINRISSLKKRHKSIMRLHFDIDLFLESVKEEEQPFGKIYDFVQNLRRREGKEVTFRDDNSILQTRSRLLSTSISIRCDLAIITDMLMLQKQKTTTFTRQNDLANREIVLDFSACRKECLDLSRECQERQQHMLHVEALIFFGRFVALNRSSCANSIKDDDDIETRQQLLSTAITHLKVAERLCKQYPGSTRGLADEVAAVMKMLKDSTFYTTVTSEEKQQVYVAMTREFRGTGHWYYCRNGHPFTVGECGAPMETSRCPQCGSPVGGEHHQPVDGVRRAEDLEERMGGLQV